MLESIHIENIALIRKLDINFTGGFAAFTGETGAGKSIIIDSIGLICGQKSSRELIRNGEEYALAEAVFYDLTKESVSRLDELGYEPDEDGYLYISRKLSADGKNNCRINGRTVPSSVLKEISAFLINIHGQHDNQDLLKSEKHLGILTAYADIDAVFNDYKEKYKAYTELKNDIKKISMDNSEKERTIEMLKFQTEEIAALKLKPDDEDTLTAEKNRLSNIEKISDSAGNAYALLYGDGINAVSAIDKAVSYIRNLDGIVEGIEEYIERLQSARSEIYDVAEYIHEMAEDTEENPAARLDKIEQKLYDIYRLKRKYGNSITEILEYYENAKTRLSDLELSDFKISELESKLKFAEAELKDAANRLTKARTDSGKLLKEQIEDELKFLDMENVKFEVAITQKPYSSDGCDEVEFLVKTNSGLPFSPLSKTASGGELSRIMLAIKSVIAKKDGVETLIFDEVDTGISGKTSRRIGIKLLQTSRHSQVMCVTHSAQIASLANTHYLVSKHDDDAGTYTICRELSSDERIDETARIIAGIDITETAKDAARELINESKKY